MEKVRRANVLSMRRCKDTSTGSCETKKLSDKQEKSLSEMIELYLNLDKACWLKVLFNDLWGMLNKTAETTFLTNWCRGVEEEKIPSFWLSQNGQEALVWHHSLR